ncbi:MAG: hypothetical protein IPM50_09085 [Acidobacteriota bacterium]|nr:MAG: hypothetical protein IPM50_09085 [Acidobacteriota bacterium]
MSNFTIPKYSLVVISCAVAFLIASACAFDSGSAAEPLGDDLRGPQVFGSIRSQDIGESSGVAASKCQNDVFWTHNDSGDGPFIYAFNVKGDNLGTWNVEGATNIDWEDMAIARTRDGRCFIYISDTGNNKQDRAEVTIYRVEEPVVTEKDRGRRKRNAVATAKADSMQLRFPDRVQDAETLMVNQLTGEIYVLTKRLTEPSSIYKFNWPENQEVVTAKLVGTLSVPAIPNGLLTGGDMSSDARRVVVCDYARAYELTLPRESNDFDDIWKQTPRPIDLGKREAGEAIAYIPDASAIVATSEKLNSPIIIVRRK